VSQDDIIWCAFTQRSEEGPQDNNTGKSKIASGLGTRDNDEPEQDSGPAIDESMLSNLKKLVFKNVGSNLLDRMKGKFLYKVKYKGTDFEDAWLNTEVDRIFVAELKILMKREANVVLKEERESADNAQGCFFFRVKSVE
jgi:hypothetical protein